MTPTGGQEPLPVPSPGTCRARNRSARSDADVPEPAAHGGPGGRHAEGRKPSSAAAPWTGCAATRPEGLSLPPGTPQPVPPIPPPPGTPASKTFHLVQGGSNAAIADSRARRLGFSAASAHRSPGYPSRKHTAHGIDNQPPPVSPPIGTPPAAQFPSAAHSCAHRDRWAPPGGGSPPPPPPSPGYRRIQRLSWFRWTGLLSRESSSGTTPPPLGAQPRPMGRIRAPLGSKPNFGDSSVPRVRR